MPSRSEIRKLKRHAAKYFLLRDKNLNYHNFFSSDCVAVFPEIRVCFNRIKKAGNTSVCAFFSELSDHPEPGSSAEMKGKIKKPSDFGLLGLVKLRSYRSFVVSRNPYTRTLSAFLDKIAFENDPKFASYPGFADPSAEGFLKFLLFLEGRKSKPNKHFWRQTDLLYQPLDRFTCVAKLESLSADLNAFLDQAGIGNASALRFDQPHSLERSETGKITGAQTKISEYYNNETMQLVEKVYRADFDLFGYKIGVLPTR